MINWFKTKIKNGIDWLKRKIKKVLIVLGIVGVAYAAGTALIPDQYPSAVAEGQVIEFPYTDDNTNENILIYTDKEIYTPLWAWNGFDVYVAVVNKSGRNQDIGLQAWFQKDFTIEKIYKLDEEATTTKIFDVVETVCSATSTECWEKKTGEKERTVKGVWREIAQKQFSKEEYDKLVAEKGIPVKLKIGNKARGHIKGFQEAGKVSFYKLTIKANEPFSREEFDVEVLGSGGGYGLLDPTILTDDFNSYTDGSLEDQSSWAIDGGVEDSIVVQGTTVKEGAKAIDNTSGNDENVKQTGSDVADGRITYYARVGATNQYGSGFRLYSGDTQCVTVIFWNDGNLIYKDSANSNVTLLAGYSANTWYCIEIEWRSSDHTVRYRVNEGTWTDWVAPRNSFTSLNAVRLDTYGANSHNMFDYIAEYPYPEAAHSIMIIEQKL